MKHVITIDSGLLRRIDEQMGQLADTMGDLQLTHQDSDFRNSDLFAQYATQAIAEYFTLQDLLHDYIFAPVIKEHGDI